MKLLLAIPLLVMLASPGDCFGLLSVSTNPTAMLNAGKMMTRVIMSNMAKKRTGGSDGLCVQMVGRAGEDFFVGASRALNLLKLIDETKARRRDPTVTSAAVPIKQFCSLVDLARLRTATNRLVARLRCMGAQAQDEAGRLFRSLVRTVGHICEQGGKPAQQFMDDVKKCRQLDPDHEQALSEFKKLHRSRRSVSDSAQAPNDAATSTTRRSERADYGSLQACLDDVNQLLPDNVRLLPQEELTDLLLTLPSMIPRLLDTGGLGQFCPALLKSADCAHYSLSQCPAGTERRLGRFFATVLRDILCEDTPSDDQLESYLVYDRVKELYFNL